MRARPTAVTRRLFWSTLGLLELVVLANPVQAQEVRGRIHGQVRDQSSGRPVAAVDVKLIGTQLATVTSERGLFVIRDIPSGIYEISAERLGYSPNSGRVEIRSGSILEVQITITSKAIELDSIRVSTRSGKLAEAGFYDRRDTGGQSGRYLTAEDIDHRRAAQMTDMFVGMQSVKVIPLGPGRVTIRFNRNVPDQGSIGAKRRRAMEGGNGGCEPDLYVDGRLFRFSSPQLQPMEAAHTSVNPSTRLMTSMRYR